ncbi:hypothetical protein [Microvirga sp. KLBC 81]|uniref:DUF6894 family protein n=1 Tax=Microvirga sp. KLBC 81 TaxID=1862707 RepID=UPI00197C46F8|nr:hypothetical protein [Microvirga sp. KLBC 81]
MRCYFHLVSSHDVILDEEGVEVADLEAAEAEARKAIQELREEDSEADEDWQGWQLNVTDRSGHVILSIPLDETPQQNALKWVQCIALTRVTQVHGTLIGTAGAMDYLSWGLLS